MAATVKFYNTDVRPATDLLLDLGTSSFRWNNLWTGGTTAFNGRTYTWPASETANYFLKTNGSGTLSWALADSSFLSVKKWGI